jgi:arylsulfatase
MTRPRAVACALALLAVGGSCTPTAPEPDAPRLLLLLTVDTLRADRLGAYGSPRGLTPHLDALAADSLVFELAYAPAPFTVPSLVSLHTGRYPAELGLQINLSELRPDVATLAGTLAANGWKTAAVVSNVVLRQRDDLARGFEIWDDTMEETEAVRLWRERTALPTTDAALRLVDLWRSDPEVSGRPLFLWVHYQDPHGPYTPPPGWRERYTEQEQRLAPDRSLPEVVGSYGEGGIPRYQLLEDRHEASWYRAGYAAEIAWMDEQVGRLLGALHERGLASRVVFAADHGEAMGEHDFWFSHGHHLTDEAVRVPLMLKLPGLAPGRRRDVASLVDVLPTLLAAALDAPPDPSLPGRNLLAEGAASQDSVPLLSTLSAYSKRRLGIVAGGYKLILTRRNDVWQPQLFRLGHEDVDLAAPAPQVTTQLRDQLWSLRERYDAGQLAPVRQISEQQRSQLEALGYMEAPEP